MAVASRKWAILAAVGFLSATAIVLVAAPRACERSTSEASRTLLGCMLEADARCMASYVGAEERVKGGVDEASLSKFLQRIWSPAIQGFRLHAQAAQKEHGPSHLDVAEVRHPDGRRLPVVAFAVRADGDAIHPSLVLDLALTSLLARRKAGQPLPAGAAKEAFYASELRSRLAEFEASGLRGATVSVQDTGRSKFYTWSELADRFDRRAELFGRLPSMKGEERAAAVRAYKEWEAAGL
jgi:hypothetical protein